MDISGPAQNTISAIWEDIVKRRHHRRNAGVRGMVSARDPSTAAGCDG
jgi:hypothetical protein